MSIEEFSPELIQDTTIIIDEFAKLKNRKVQLINYLLNKRPSIKINKNVV